MINVEVDTYTVLMTTAFTCAFAFLVWFWLWLRKVDYIVSDISEGGFDKSIRYRSVAKTKRHLRTETSRQNLERPIPPVFPNGWIPVALSEELPKETVKPLNVMGEELVMFRTAEGKVHVLDAYCPHLGAHMGAGGRVVGNCIECPFHGWQFDGEKGNCTKVPYAEKQPNFIKTKAWKCAELLDLIFIWYHAEGLEPYWEIPDRPEVTQKQWSLRAHTEHNVKCLIQEIPENAADEAHLNMIHAPFFMGGGDYQEASKSFLNKIAYHAWKNKWEPNPPPNSHTAIMRLRCMTSIFGYWPWFLQFDVVVHQIGPALVVIELSNKFGNGIMIESVTPEGPFRQRVVHRFYVDSRFPRIISKYFIWSAYTMFDRDVSVWNNKVFLNRPTLVSEDRSILSFRKWFSQFFSENSPKIDDVLKKSTVLEW